MSSGVEGTGGSLGFDPRKGRGGEGSHLPGVVTVSVSSLRPTESGSRLGSNLLRVLPDVMAALSGKEWYPKLKSDVRKGKKTAVVITALGSLAIFVAAAGIELGLRHGHDLAVFDKLLKRGKKK